jgi:Tol biopolymer transport system component/DNA-binding winged helix-turn-helix (wHTH) protein
VREAAHSPRLVRFAAFEVDLQAGELRKSGLKLKLTGQPFQVLAILLERPGEVVTREELQKRLWPDTFVDVDHNLNTAINKIREVLGDSAESPRFVETLPRRGYRFIAPLDSADNSAKLPAIATTNTAVLRGRIRAASLLLGALGLLACASFLVYKKLHVSPSPGQRTLTRLTFDDGLQIGATWSPDTRFIAYSSDRGGKFDIWVQAVSGGDPVQVTKGPGQNWQPDWSPDGKYIAYRSEDGEGGLYIVPAFGGVSLQRKIVAFGYYPRWSPDSSQILFQTHFTGLDTSDRFYVVGVDGSAPREVIADFISHQPLQHEHPARSAAWHPDGKRISLWALGNGPNPDLWTISLATGVAVKSEIVPEVVERLSEASGGPKTLDTDNFRFSWAPSGSAIYFERTFRGATNIWRMSMDPLTLRGVSVERITTGPGVDTELCVSSDGRKLAFTGEVRKIRTWMFPFDVSTGRVSGPGQAVTSPGTEAWLPSLSRDGRRLAFGGIRAGKFDLWEKLLPDGPEAPVVADESHGRAFGVWSPDGTRLAYGRSSRSTDDGQIVQWSSKDRSEEPLTTPDHSGWVVFDWSPDGKSILAETENAAEGHSEIWQIPADAGPHAEATARKVIFNPGYFVFQSRFSPDGRWIVFEGVRDKPSGIESAIYVMHAAGGPWIQITDGKNWDDKPVWSPDGKSIYFVSGRGGFFNVWGVRFDSEKGKIQGVPFTVTDFDRPSLMVPRDIPNVQLSLSQDRLVLTVAQVSGSIWVLDNVGQ